GGLQREVAQDDGGAGRAGVRRVLEVGRAGGGARDVHGDGRAAGDEERLRRLRGAPRVVLKGDGEGVRAGGDAGRVPADGEGLHVRASHERAVDAEVRARRAARGRALGAQRDDARDARERALGRLRLLAAAVVV